MELLDSFTIINTIFDYFLLEIFIVSITISFSSTDSWNVLLLYVRVSPHFKTPRGDKELILWTLVVDYDADDDLG